MKGYVMDNSENTTGAVCTRFNKRPFPAWETDLDEMVWSGSEDAVLDYGLYELDGVLQGIHRGELILVAGKMGCGKSDFAEMLVYNLCWRQKAVGIFFALGTKARYTLAGLTAIHARMSYNAVLRNCAGRESNQAKARAALQELSAMRMVLDDSGGLSLAEIEERIRDAKKQHDIAFAVISKWQNFANPYEYDDNGLCSLKRVAVDLDIPVVLFARMSKTAPKRLNVEDVGESGFFDSPDVIVLMHGEDTERAGVLVFHIVKNCNGGTGFVRAAYINQQHRIENHAQV